MLQFILPILTMTVCFGSTIPQAQDLTLEEKVGQIFMVHFRGETANEAAQTVIRELHVGSIIYYNWANGLNSSEQVKQLSSGLQALASIPLIIAVDQEGGVVTRLNKEFTVFPGNRALGMTGKPDLAEQSAYAMGEELLTVGVNMNLAPVVDVNSNPKNPVIGVRSFGDVPESVVSFGRKALEGYRRAGVINCLKHFPGHGDTSVDSHKNLPVLNKTMEELQRTELFPFATLAKDADTIMTAHLLIPAFDPNHCSTLSKKTLDYLRNQIGFQGVILSDSLIMGGVLQRCNGSADEAAIQAFNAGCDILILGGSQLIGENQRVELTITDLRRIHKNFVLAVKNGRISEEALDRSVTRILKLKAKHLSVTPKSQTIDHQTPVSDCQNSHTYLRPDLPDKQSAERDSNLHQVVEREHEAYRDKDGPNMTANFCNQTLVSDCQNSHTYLRPDLPDKQSAERDSNLHQVVEREHEAYQDKDGPNMTANFCNQTLALTIASLALQTCKNDPACAQSLNKKTIGVVAPELLKGIVDPLFNVGKEGQGWFFNGLSPTAEEAEMIKKQAKTVDILAICSYNSWKNPAQAELIHALLAEGKPVLLLAMRDPLDTTLFPQANIIFTTFSPTAAAIQAVCNELIRQTAL